MILKGAGAEDNDVVVEDEADRSEVWGEDTVKALLVGSGSVALPLRHTDRLEVSEWGGNGQVLADLWIVEGLVVAGSEVDLSKVEAYQDHPENVFCLRNAGRVLDGVEVEFAVVD